MNVDLGWLGKVVLEPYDFPQEVAFCKFKITHDGYTESGIRVHGVIDDCEYATYPCVWQNAILIKVWS